MLNLAIGLLLSLSMFRGDATHTGVYAPVSGRNLIGMQWRFPTAGEVNGSPTVDGDTVYVGSGDGKLYAIDLWSGLQKWRYDAGSAISSTPAVSDTMVYIATRRGDLLAIDKTSHKPRWQHRSGPEVKWPWGHESYDSYISSPVLQRTTVVFGAGDGNVYAFDAATGRTKWTAATGERIRATPAIADGAVFIGTAGGKIYRFDLASGKRDWTFATDGASLDSSEFGYDRRTIVSSAAVAGGAVYAGSRDGKFYAIDEKTGALRWKTDYGVFWVITSPAVAEDRVYIGSSDGKFVQCLSASDGKELWKNDLGTRVWSSLAVSGGLLFAGDDDGNLNAFDRTTGARLWSFPTAATVNASPVVARNFVVFGSNDGGVYALRIGSEVVRRAVYAYEPKPEDNASKLVKFLGARGYQPLDDAKALTAFLSDHAASVIVFANRGLPDEARPLLRSYLESGGKIVWSGVPPGVIPNDPSKLQQLGPKAIDYGAPEALIGVSHAETGSDPRTTHATIEGQRWGLDGRWRSGWGVPVENVSVPLSLDEWGFTTEWVKSFGGPSGTGFVRARGGDNDTLYWMAEYRPQDRTP